jgi:TPP-dependent pyruvate/acetoin dehydrogenase alpha subunit
VAQVLLGTHLTDPNDAACGYYRSRPMLLALGVDVADALGSNMARAGGYSDGRDIGVVFNYPNPSGASALPMCGGVGAQYTPTCGWAQAAEYRRTVLGDAALVIKYRAARRMRVVRILEMRLAVRRPRILAQLARCGRVCGRTNECL